jgi:hypothetical protein
VRRRRVVRTARRAEARLEGGPADGGAGLELGPEPVGAQRSGVSLGTRAHQARERALQVRRARPDVPRQAVERDRLVRVRVEVGARARDREGGRGGGRLGRLRAAPPAGPNPAVAAPRASAKNATFSGRGRRDGQLGRQYTPVVRTA